jgi:hypothetical protein
MPGNKTEEPFRGVRAGTTQATHKWSDLSDGEKIAIYVTSSILGLCLVCGIAWVIRVFYG